MNELNANLTKEIAKFQNTSVSDETVDTVSSELIVLCEGIKGNITKFAKAQTEFEEELDSPDTTPGSSSAFKESFKEEAGSKPNSDHYRIEGLDDINKSSMINFDLENAINWFDSLRGLQKLAISIIIGKGLLISALSSIISIYYGDFLIEKFELVKKFPRLAKFIMLRKKYQKYTLYFNLLLIVLVVTTEILVGLTLLGITI